MRTTTLEESKRLVELGLDPKTADCYWCKQLKDWRGKDITHNFYIVYHPYKDRNHIVCGFETFEEHPAWSLDALLSLLPSEKDRCWQITRGGWEFLEKDGSYNKDACFISLEVENENIYESKVSGSFFEAAYNMITWLLANGIKI